MKKALIIIIWFVPLALVIYSFIRTEQFLINGTLTLGWLFFVIQLTMNNYENVYLHVNKLWFKIKNPDCIWNMQVSMVGDFNRGNFVNIEECLHSLSTDLRISIISSTRKIYRVSTLGIEVSINETTGEIIFAIHDLEVSFRRSTNIIEKELGDIFEKLQKKLKPDVDNYGLRIEFKGYNPYFGFFVRRLNASDIQGFNVTFKIDNDRIAVSNTGIEINTDSLQHLNNLSKEYISLSPAK